MFRMLPERFRGDLERMISKTLLKIENHVMRVLPLPCCQFSEDYFYQSVFAEDAKQLVHNNTEI